MATGKETICINIHFHKIAPSVRGDENKKGPRRASLSLNFDVPFPREHIIAVEGPLFSQSLALFPPLCTVTTSCSIDLPLGVVVRFTVLHAQTASHVPLQYVLPFPLSDSLVS